jgi:hypothetical protein
VSRSVVAAAARRARAEAHGPSARTLRLQRGGFSATGTELLPWGKPSAASDKGRFKTTTHQIQHVTI